jgi:hypothetical protein
MDDDEGDRVLLRNPVLIYMYGRNGSRTLESDRSINANAQAIEDAE